MRQQKTADRLSAAPLDSDLGAQHAQDRRHRSPSSRGSFLERACRQLGPHGHATRSIPPASINSLEVATLIFAELSQEDGELPKDLF